MKADLIAPCGMNCGICKAYLRSKNQNVMGPVEKSEIDQFGKITAKFDIRTVSLKNLGRHFFLSCYENFFLLI